MVETATDDGSGGGRDIGRMFKRQEEVLKEWKVKDKDVPPEAITDPKNEVMMSTEPNQDIKAEPSAGNDAMESNCGGALYSRQHIMDEDVDWEDEEGKDFNRCHRCGAGIPEFAMTAHQLYHALGD